MPAFHTPKQTHDSIQTQPRATLHCMRSPRLPIQALLLATLALVVRLVAVPIERHRFEGHELDYLAAFSGQPWEPSTRTFPLLAEVYAVVGLLFSSPYSLVILNLVASLLTVAAAWWWAKKHLNETAAWMLAALLALSPTHAFWASSIYNVTLPQACLVLGIALGGWRGSAAVAIACNLRIELALFAPLILLLSDRKVALGCLGALFAWPLMDSAPHVVSPVVALPVNLGLPEMLGPLGTPVGLLLLALAVQKHNAHLAASAVAVHLIGSAFDDYGTRHGLFGGLCAMAVLASATGWRRMLAPLACLLFASHLQTLRAQVRMPQHHFNAQLPDLPHAQTLPADCHEILDDPLAERSHWRVRSDWPTGRVCWGEERIHVAWTTRGLQDRRVRMHKTYTLTPFLILDLESGPRVIYEVEQ